MYRYRTYGLNIESDVPLEGVPGSNAPADVTVRAERLTMPPLCESLSDISFAATPDGNFFQYTDVGSFCVRSKSELLYTRADGASDEAIAHVVLGPGLALIQRLRGLCVLHASTVLLLSGAVAFLGNSGWGKSTMAAALVARGHSLIGDDVLPVETRDGRAVVCPGPPRANLTPQSAAFFGTHDTTTDVDPASGKHVLHLDPVVLDSNIPLRAAYILGVAEEFEIETLGPARSAVALAQNSFGIHVLQHQAGEYLQRCGRTDRVCPDMFGESSLPCIRNRRRISKSESSPQVSHEPLPDAWSTTTLHEARGLCLYGAGAHGRFCIVTNESTRSRASRTFQTKPSSKLSHTVLCFYDVSLSNTMSAKAAG